MPAIASERTCTVEAVSCEKDALGEVIAVLPDHNRMDLPLLCCGDLSGADYYEGIERRRGNYKFPFSAHYQCFLILFVLPS